MRETRKKAKDSSSSGSRQGHNLTWRTGSILPISGLIRQGYLVGFAWRSGILSNHLLKSCTVSSGGAFLLSTTPLSTRSIVLLAHTSKHSNGSMFGAPVPSDLPSLLLQGWEFTCCTNVPRNPSFDRGNTSVSMASLYQCCLATQN